MSTRARPTGGGGGDLEVADFQRFARAVQLGSWLGLVPSRQQSGESDTHGSITKTGSRYARRILVEAAWLGQRAADPGRERNKPGNVITVACARELSCFLWAAATAP
jgi:transposase